MSKDLWRIILLIPILVFFALTGGRGEAGGGLYVMYTLTFGPAPESLGDPQGKYMWVVPEILNSNGDQVVTVSLQVTGAPAGCQQEIELVLPGQDTFWMLSGEVKYILWRVRYECHAPAYPEVFPLEITPCVEGEFESDCDNVTKNLIIATPSHELHGVSTDTGRALFMLWPLVGPCLLPWPIDWYAFASQEAGGLGGSPLAIYLHWFLHGVHIHNFFDPDRPFDLCWNYETWLSYIPWYGAGWHEEREMSEYTTTTIPDCNELWYPGLRECSQGDVGYTYIDAEFHGWAGMTCEGPIGWNCVGSDGVHYYYHFTD